MNDFDAILKRSFAEAPEPVDDGFSVNVSHAVSHAESAIKVRNATYSVGMATAGAAILYGAYTVATAFGQEFLASAGLEVARAHSAMSSAPSMSGAAQGFMQTLSAGVMTQILLVTAALAGGAVAYRASQD
jgi:hypothetical protein